MHTQDVFRGPARGGGPSSRGRLCDGWLGGEGGGTLLLGAAGSVTLSTSFLAAYGMWKVEDTNIPPNTKTEYMRQIEYMAHICSRMITVQGG